MGPGTRAGCSGASSPQPQAALMTQQEPSTPAITVESLKACRWRQAGDCDTYMALSERLRSLAMDAEREGAPTEAAALGLLAHLCGMGLDVDIGKGPFQPLMAFTDGRRTLLPEDLTPDELKAVAAFSEERDVPPLLRARLADVAWLRMHPRQPAYARSAIDAYRVREPTAENWLHGRREEYVRAIQLCRELGKDCAERLAEIEGVLLRIVFSEQPVAPGFLLSVADVLAVQGMAVAKRREIAVKLETVAQDFEKRSVWNTARDLFIASAKWFSRASNDVATALATSKAAEMWLREGEFYDRNGGTGYMMAGAAYESAVQLLRTIPRKHREPHEVEVRLADLRRRLRECNERSLDAMEPVSGESVDISELVEAARKAVTGKDAWSALVALAKVSVPPPSSHWRDQAIQTIKEYPLQALFMSSRLSRDGRLIARSPGLDFRETGSAAWNEAVRERAVQNHGFYEGLVVQGGIIPALDAMTLEHRLTEGDFVTLAARSPIVPLGRERTVGRGLCAGYRRDFATAVHLLTPQIEHIVRTHIAAVGGETRKLDASGVETEVGLSALLELPEAEKVFGETIAFELRAIFTDAAGPNLRNNLAHGLLDDAEVLSASSVYAWWFSLRLIMLPLMQKPKVEDSSATTTDPAADKKDGS